MIIVKASVFGVVIVKTLLWAMVIIKTNSPVLIIIKTFGHSVVIMLIQESLVVIINGVISFGHRPDHCVRVNVIKIFNQVYIFKNIDRIVVLALMPGVIIKPVARDPGQIDNF